VLEFGKPFRFGLEAGSKPELMAVMALADNDTPIICNGFKDDEYIEMAMLAQKMGRKIIPVVEKYTELHLILKYSQRVGVRPTIGLRVKLASRGSGRWKSSGGYRSKFGLSATEAVRALQELKDLGMSDCLNLLHFHLGSQITNIRQVKGAVNEAVRVYVDLARAGAGLRYLDVGSGLRIDYDGSQTDFESSVNYTLQEYANDIVYHIQSVCDESQVPHPTIVTESGRAVTAYHSALVFNVLGVSGLGETEPGQWPAEPEQPLIDLQLTDRGLTTKNLLESYHDAQQALDQALNLFSLGYLPLDQRCLAENLYWSICRRIQKLARELEFFPEELEGIDAMLSDTLRNFSLFQSMPDGWAINQLFLHADPLARRATRNTPFLATLCAIRMAKSTSSSTAAMSRKLCRCTATSKDYYLGAFLLGAYQDFGRSAQPVGDTNAVYVRG
jgi:arginine decarboxylase